MIFQIFGRRKMNVMIKKYPCIFVYSSLYVVIYFLSLILQCARIIHQRVAVLQLSQFNMFITLFHYFPAIGVISLSRFCSIFLSRFVGSC
eukprot:UN33161